MIAGFTGTQRGMSELQKADLETELKRLKITVLHHGVCIGADDEANTIARSLDIETEGHPPIKTARIASLDVTVMHPPEEYIERNHDIVDCVEILFVAPTGSTEILRSGTWATYRYARHVGRDIIMLKR